MKLSEAIRAGAKMRPQAFGVSRDHKGGTCAFGAAWDGVTEFYARAPSRLSEMLDNGEVLYSTEAPCPARGCPGVEGPHYQDPELATSVMMHLNDYHRWSREAIAEWVETIENSLESKPEPFKDKVQEEKPVKVAE